jgi:hypothetical protein
MRFIRSVTDVFGYSPFKAIHKHSEYCEIAADLLVDQFEAFVNGDKNKIFELEQEIDDLEHEADKIKQEIRTHVTKSLRLPVDRHDLLSFLSYQDQIINYIEHVCHMLTYRGAKDVDKEIERKFRKLLHKINEIICKYEELIDHVAKLIATSFSKKEITEVLVHVNEVEIVEHECDIVQIELHKLLLNSEMDPFDVILLRDIVIQLGEVANSTARAADSFRTMILGR